MGSKISTKINNARQASRFLNYCSDIGEDPVDWAKESLNPSAVLLWYGHMTHTLGCCNSWESWSAGLTWLCKILNLPTDPKPRHQADSKYKLFVKILLSGCKRQSKEKHPCDALMIATYIKNHLGIVPGRYHETSYNNLMKAYLIVLLFLGAYRPSELIYSKQTEELNGQTKVRIKGLRWDHVKFLSHQKFKGGKAMRIKVPFFKNQRDVTVPLMKTFSSPLCKKAHNKHKKCICAYFDTFAMHDALKKMRANRRKNPCPFNRFGSKTPLGKKRLTMLSTDPEDFVFVNSNGHVIKYDNLRKIVQEMVEALGLDKEAYAISAHCFRVGATSTAYAQGIPILAMCKYVEWAVHALRVAHSGYVKILETQTATIPFDLLHGAMVDGARINKVGRHPPVWVLRNDVLRSMLYGESANTKGNPKMPRAKEAKWAKWGPND